MSKCSNYFRGEVWTKSEHPNFLRPYLPRGRGHRSFGQCQKFRSFFFWLPLFKVLLEWGLTLITRSCFRVELEFANFITLIIFSRKIRNCVPHRYALSQSWFYFNMNTLICWWKLNVFNVFCLLSFVILILLPLGMYQNSITAQKDIDNVHLKIRYLEDFLKIIFSICVTYLKYFLLMASQKLVKY